MYYWDGATWVSTLSADGRYRWNGVSWEPLATPPPVYTPAGPAQREPTSWTRPLQYAVAAWYAISALGALTMPFWLSGQMRDIMNSALQQSEQQHPNAAPPPPGFVDAMTSMMQGVLWVGMVFGLVVCVVLIVGALKRWTWAYYVVLILLGLGVISEPGNLVSYATNAYMSTRVYTPPSWLYVLGIVAWVPTTALFVVMLIALVKRGPWAMTRVSPGASPAA